MTTSRSDEPVPAVRVPVHRLHAVGVWVAFPSDRRLPTSASAVLADLDARVVYRPTLVIEDGYIVGAKTMRLDAFDDYVDEGTTQRIEPAVPARLDDHGRPWCYLWREGDAEPEYVSLRVAAGWLNAFAEKHQQAGDHALRNGDLAAAQSLYEAAAAVAQSPEAISRMLILPLPLHRHGRHVDALAQVARLDPPTEHIKRVRLEIWPTHDHRSCPVCDRPEALPDEQRRCGDAFSVRGVSFAVCWRERFPSDCDAHAVDWRERYLACKADNAALREHVAVLETVAGTIDLTGDEPDAVRLARRVLELEAELAQLRQEHSR